MCFYLWISAFITLAMESMDTQNGHSRSDGAVSPNRSYEPSERLRDS